MQRRVIAPAAINALKQALTHVYWYKSDLRSFLLNTISNPGILSRLNWDDYKRNIVTTLVEFLAKDQDNYQGDLLRLISEVTRMRNFTHLRQLEDGDGKEQRAKEAVKALSELSEAHLALVDEQKEIEERRRRNLEKRLKNEGVRERLGQLQEEYFGLLRQNPNERGYSLERLMHGLFDLFDLDPKASFKITGEQLDGAFSFEGADFLFEARWRNEQAGAPDLSVFSEKLRAKLENTLGLFLSINGFSEDSIKKHSSGRRLMILMDGSDLMAVLEGRIELVELLLRKRRHASQTGNIYLRLHDILR